MKNEEAQRLLGDDLPTDSKTTTTTKGYSSGVRLSMAFGTFAFLLLGVVLFAGRGGKINTNIVHNTIRSSGKEKLHTKTSQAMREKPADCNLPRFKKGMCETTGTYNDVLPYLDHQKVIPGKIYYGLDFDHPSYYGKTSTPHTDYFDFDGIVRQSCLWGHGASVGKCTLDDYRGSNVCPSPQRHIVRAWQECAELCNNEPYCSTFTVHTKNATDPQPTKSNDILAYNCFFHKTYECRKENGKSVGINDYKHHNDIRDAKYDNLGVWSGICRTISGRTNDYACTNTPVDDCHLCRDQKNHCCHFNAGWNYHCPGC